jgi:two-component system chemotaxis sensor kinase CheA
LNLREWFSVNGAIPDLQQVVIIQDGDERVGLAVDSVIGEHQTVIKNLGRVYRDAEGVAGATILGDGSVSLILDVSRIIGLVKSAEKAEIASRH